MMVNSVPVPPFPLPIGEGGEREKSKYRNARVRRLCHHQMLLGGGVRSPGLMSGGTLPCDISHDAFDVTYHPPPPSTGVSTLDVYQTEHYNHKILDLE